MTECAFYDGNEELLRRRKTLPRTEFDFSDRTRTIRRNANYMTEKAIPATDCHFFGSTRFFGQKVFFFSDEICHVSPTETIPATERMAFLQQNAISTPFFCDVRYVCPPTGCDFCAVFLRRGMYVCDVCLPTRDAISTRFCATP